jgi:hypothetical protein
MKLSKLFLLGVGALALGACDDDGSATAGPPGPQAYIRFVHSTADMGTVDFRFIDHLENLPMFLGVQFRSTTGLHQAVDAGVREFRIFRNSTDPATAATRLVDSTLTLEAGKYYLLLYTGLATGNADRLEVIEETLPTSVPAGQIAVKAVHAFSGAGALDVAVIDTLTPGVATEIAPGVSYLGASPYANLTTAASNTLYRFEFRDAGTTTAVAGATPNEPGQGASGSVSKQAGVRVAGSALTAVALPGAVPGSPAENAAGTNLTPTVLLLLDNIPQ